MNIKQYSDEGEQIKTQSEIDRTLQDLSYKISLVGELVDKVFVRLNPVLDNRPKATEAVDDKKEIECSCDLSRNILDKYDKLSSIENTLHIILDDLKL